MKAQGSLLAHRYPNGEAVFTIRQISEFFRFELRQQLRHPSFWISAVVCVAAGIAFSATEMGDLQVAAGRVASNVPYAVLRNLAGLSAIGMFVVMVSVAKAAMRDFSSGTAPLIFSRPVSTTGYLVGRFAGGYCVGALAVLIGAAAMVITQAWLAVGNAQMAPVSADVWFFGVFVLLLPNLFILSSLVFLLALWSRSMGVTFLGLLLIMIGQDLAEIIPVVSFGYRLPALLDPLGLAALTSVARDWGVVDYASRFPGLSGDFMLNRLLWFALTMFFCFLARPVFAYRARRADAGEKRKAIQSKKPKRASKPFAQSKVVPSTPLRRAKNLWLAQCLSIFRFEFRCFTGSLAWRFLFVGGVLLTLYGMTRGSSLIGVESLPGASSVLYSINRAARTVMTLLVVLFSGELVWRERGTRMGLTLDAMPIARGALVAGKFLALVVLVGASIGTFGLVAMAMQKELGVSQISFAQVWIPVLHESVNYLQIAAISVFLQTIAGGRMRGYLATGLFLALRLAGKALGHTGVLYSMASTRLPFASAMSGWAHGLEEAALVQGYWVLVGATLMLAAGMFWPHGAALTWKQTLARAQRRCTGWARIALLLCVTASLGGAAWIQQTTLAPAMGWNQNQSESFLASYEKEYQSWQGRPRPQVIAITADVELDPAGRYARVQGMYLLENHQAGAVETMLFNFDPNFQLLGLSLSPSDGLLTEASATQGTRVLQFDPPLAAGASVELHFDLEFAPKGLGSRPTDRWLVENGSFILGGTGTHPFFRGGQFFPSLGYDTARELRERRPRKEHGMDPWEPRISAAEYEARRAGMKKNGTNMEVFGSPDWAQVDLWIHTPEDQTALAPGKLLERFVGDGKAHHHFRTSKRIQAFFSIISGRYEKVVAKQGSIDIEIYFHAPHQARVAHILWAVQQSLAYFEEHWGPYPHEVLRLGEIPGESGFAASLPGVMGFGEAMAFTSPRGAGQALDFPPAESAESQATDLDPILWIVAHEVAHQWWDGHVLPALALGASFTSESLAQYGSLAVVQKIYGADVALRMVKYSRKTYLSERSRAVREERALVHVDDQAHLHYEKGMVAFHALASEVGYEPINRALASLVLNFGGPEGRPITSLNLMQALRRSLPEASQPMLIELLEKIVFVESAIDMAETELLPNQSYLLLVEGVVSAVEADGDGKEKPFDYQGVMELLVLFEDHQPSQLLRAPVVDGKVRFEVHCTTRPWKVRMDPRLLHIDRELNKIEAFVKEKIK